MGSGDPGTGFSHLDSSFDSSYNQGYRESRLGTHKYGFYLSRIFQDPGLNSRILELKFQFLGDSGSSFRNWTEYRRNTGSLVSVPVDCEREDSLSHLGLSVGTEHLHCGHRGTTC